MKAKALRWRQRRGMKELDVLLERYFRRHHENASDEEKAAFERLLEREDPEIWLWVVGSETVPAEFADVIAALRRHD
ncbi:MAG: succinate dehydrogenase assembly factor 2 [Nevskiaceae bacterium]